MEVDRAGTAYRPRDHEDASLHTIVKLVIYRPCRVLLIKVYVLSLAVSSPLSSLMGAGASAWLHPWCPSCIVVTGSGFRHVLDAAERNVSPWYHVSAGGGDRIFGDQRETFVHFDMLPSDGKEASFSRYADFRGV